MRLFNDLRKNPLTPTLGVVAAGSGSSGLGGTPPLPHQLRAPYYLAGALVLGLVLLAALPHHSNEEASLSQIEWQAGEDNNADAQLLLGLAYRNGSYGLPVDDKRATTWLARAAAGGNAYAAGVLGDAYAQGTGVKADPVRANYWWHQAAQGGDRHGAARLGQAVSAGERLMQVLDLSSQSASALLHRAEGGDNVAQFQLAMRYRDGSWGVNADPRRARYWLQQAASHGNPVAMNALAEAYAQGAMGLSADASLAARWHRRADLAGRGENPGSALL